MKQEKDIEKKHEILDNLEKSTPFSVPKDYFEVLPEVISSKNLDSNKLKYSFDKLSYRILAPICGILLLFGAYYFMNNSANNSVLTADQISEVLIEETYDDFDEEMLIESYAELLAENENPSEDEELYIDYLIESDIEFETLVESY